MDLVKLLEKYNCSKKELILVSFFLSVENNKYKILEYINLNLNLDYDLYLLVREFIFTGRLFLTSNEICKYLGEVYENMEKSHYPEMSHTDFLDMKNYC